MYSADLSLFVLDAGIRILERDRPHLMYLSLTDYIQHKYAPAEAEARQFYIDLDERFGRLAALGAVVALTADHGMNDKSNAAGRPNVIWLQDILDKKFGKGDTRVICPITDAFVAHHGALGGFVRVWCRGKATPKEIIDVIRGIDGIESVLDKGTACRRFDLPADREADVVVISNADVCVGGLAAEHDLSGLEGHRLRTHGGTTEAKVPFVVSQPLNDAYRLKAAATILKSYQIFDFAINGPVQ
jgi:phosphonoacetate hydrolase